MGNNNGPCNTKWSASHDPELHWRRHTQKTTNYRVGRWCFVFSWYYMVYGQNYLIYSFLASYRKKCFSVTWYTSSLRTAPTPTKSLFLLCTFSFKIYWVFVLLFLKDLFLLMCMSVCLHICLYIMCVNALTNQTRIPLNCDFRWLLAFVWIREIK